jgi:hypothetical protein
MPIVVCIKLPGPWGLMYTEIVIAVFVYPRGVISASTEK